MILSYSEIPKLAFAFIANNRNGDIMNIYLKVQKAVAFLKCFQKNNFFSKSCSPESFSESSIITLTVKNMKMFSEIDERD